MTNCFDHRYLWMAQNTQPGNDWPMRLGHQLHPAGEGVNHPVIQTDGLSVRYPPCTKGLKIGKEWKTFMKMISIYFYNDLYNDHWWSLSVCPWELRHQWFSDFMIPMRRNHEISLVAPQTSRQQGKLWVVYGSPLRRLLQGGLEMSIASTLTIIYSQYW